MSKYRLTLQKEGQAISTVEMGLDALVIGRAEDSDVYLPDDCISRHHARLYIDNDKLVIEDLDSMNGVIVNGLATHSSCLHGNDIVQLGHYTLLVDQSEDENPLNLTTKQIPFSEAETLNEQILQSDGGASLRVLYRIARVLTNPAPEEALLQEVLELLHSELPVKRGFAITREAGTGQNRLAASVANGESDVQPPLSDTLIKYVMRTRNAVLTSNAQLDPRFSESRSIFKHGIHAALCAPLLGRKKLVGVLYVDADSEGDTFTNEHLQILTIVGQMAGVTLENARLSEKRIQQERLAAIGEAVASTSHCMKNILTGISTGTEMMEVAYEQEDWKRLGTGLRVLRQSVNRFSAVVANMLSWSGDSKPVKRPAILNDLVAESVETLRALAMKRSVEFVVKLGEMRPIPLDTQQLYRVMLNLLNNAIEACEDKGGTVTVSTFQGATFTRFSVKDTGKGIPPEHMENISRAFFTTKGGGGTGLGLAVTYRIIHAHGGQIRVFSPPGEGAKFSVVLPHPPGWNDDGHGG